MNEPSALKLANLMLIHPPPQALPKLPPPRNVVSSIYHDVNTPECVTVGQSLVPKVFFCSFGENVFLLTCCT